MRFKPEQTAPLIKSAAVGALTGVFFSILFVALPGAALIFLVGVFNLDLDLSWFPSVITILALGGGGGSIFAAALFIKDRYIPYVEQVQEFEDDSDDDRFR
ncbi:MAG: hypothetical protein JKY12_09620 [Sneathiella sp.]|nr:hypothetical protein [Sneathiella sp.]